MSDLTSAEFFARNDDLAKRYKDASPSARQNILGELYRLDLKLFQGWRVLGEEDRQDYQQEAALWLDRALATYKPGKGPFVNHLRGYILNTFRHHVRTHKRQGDNLDDTPELSDTETETRHDPLFWKRVKAQVTPDEWDLIRLRFHEGKGINEIAKLKGTYAERIRAPLARALTAIKTASIPTHHEYTKNVSQLDPVQTCWIPPQQLADRLGLLLTAVQGMCDAGRPKHYCRIQIDPRDLLTLSRQRIRIRFLETDKGLIYPRFIERNKIVGRAGHL